MITNILEFKFSDHYNSSPDNRLALRVINAQLVSDPSASTKLRFLRAVLSVLIGDLDKIQLASNIKSCLIVVPLYLKRAGKISPLEFSADSRVGSMYTVIVSNDRVVTILINKVSDSNEEIIKKAEQHSGEQIDQLYSWQFKPLQKEGKNRTSLVIDLDQSENEFLKSWPAVKLVNNSWNEALTSLEKDYLTKTVFSPQFTQTSDEWIMQVKDLIKEWTFTEGDEILVPYPDGPKLKKVRKIIQDTKGDKTKWLIEFEKTLKPFYLTAGTQFIISPKIKKDKYYKMLAVFGLSDQNQIFFQGPIKSVSAYKGSRFNDGKLRLGIIIEPRQVKFE